MLRVTIRNKVVLRNPEPYSFPKRAFGNRDFKTTGRQSKICFLLISDKRFSQDN